MTNETMMTVTSVTAAILIALAAIAWGQTLAFALVLMGLGTDWLRGMAAEAGIDASYLFLVTAAVYPLAAIVALVSQI